MGEGPTRALARFAAEVSFDRLSADAAAATRLLLIDIVGITIAGWSTRIGSLPACAKLAMGGVSEATVLGTGERLPCGAAVYANVSLGIALEADDTLFFLGHHGPGVVLPALAAAEAYGRDGRALLAAIAAGYEVSGRLARAAVHIRREQDGTITRSPLVGTNYGALAAAATSASLAGLDREQAASAFGIAAYHSAIPTSGRALPPPRTLAKYNAYAGMAEAGSFAVTLAAMGFTGDDRVLDGDGNGDWFEMSGSLAPDRASLVSGLCESWLITSLSWKLYPCCRFMHGAIDLLRGMMVTNAITAHEIEAIDVYVSGHSFGLKLDRPEVESEVDVQFSMPFALALTAYGITPGPDWMASPLRQDLQLLGLRDRVAIHHWPEADAVMLEGKLSGTEHRRPTRLVLRARGERFESAVEYFSGDPWAQTTRLGESEIVAKFHDFASAVPREARDRFIAAALTAERLADMSALVAPLRLL